MADAYMIQDRERLQAYACGRFWLSMVQGGEMWCILTFTRYGSVRRQNAEIPMYSGVLSVFEGAFTSALRIFYEFFRNFVCHCAER